MRELERAFQAHHDWVDGFQSRLVTRSRPRPHDLKAAGHLRCALKRVRRYDRVARYGGEEFLRLLPENAPAARSDGRRRTRPTG